MTRELLRQALTAIEESSIQNETAQDIRNYLAATETIGTHSDDCWTWGPRHYECAVRRTRELEADLEAMKHWIADWYAKDAELAALKAQKSEPSIPEGYVLAPKMLHYDLLGVIADVEQGDGFDDVCLSTIKRVCGSLLGAQPSVEVLYENPLGE
jgi:hypothetical protein